MKKNTYILLATLLTMLTISLTSCKDDEPEMEGKEPKVEGRWVFSKRILQFYTVNPETGEEEILDEQIQEGKDGVEREFWYFKKDIGSKEGLLTIYSTPYSTQYDNYFYDESKKEITFDPGDPDYEIIFKVTKLTLEDMTFYSDIWDDEEGVGCRVTIEFWKWWSDL